MDVHAAFTAWCSSNDITITGIAPRHFPGRGLGIAATAPIKARLLSYALPTQPASARR